MHMWPVRTLPRSVLYARSLSRNACTSVSVPTCKRACTFTTEDRVPGSEHNTHTFYYFHRERARNVVKQTSTSWCVPGPPLPCVSLVQCHVLDGLKCNVIVLLSQRQMHARAEVKIAKSCEIFIASLGMDTVVLVQYDSIRSKLRWLAGAYHCDPSRTSISINSFVKNARINDCILNFRNCIKKV